MSGHRVTSIILSRFILALRQNTGKDPTSGAVSNCSTIDFVQRVEDGLGGSLGSAYGDGIEEDVDENGVFEHPESMLTSFEGRVGPDNVNFNR